MLETDEALAKGVATHGCCAAREARILIVQILIRREPSHIVVQAPAQVSTIAVADMQKSIGGSGTHGSNLEGGWVNAMMPDGL